MAKGKARKKVFSFSANMLTPKKSSKPDVTHLQTLLARYGYLGGGFCPGKYDKLTQHAVSQFQSFYGIHPDVDCVCDECTTKLLCTPRCGVADNPAVSRSASGRLAPFVSVGATWPDPKLNFKFLNSTTDLTVARQRKIIREAFSAWAKVSALQFTEVDANHESELSIAFHAGSHGDSNPFDSSGGPDGNTLAHAFFPPPAGGSWAGSMHFDDFELWKDQPGGAGTRLYNVALHEIGHLLGLQHSQDQNAIMYAYYAENRNDLRADDIAGAQDLYGGPTADPVVISMGDQISGHLARKDAESHYQVTVQNKLIISLDGPAGQDFDLFVRYGKPVERNKNNGYDQVSWGVTADEVIAIDNPQAGTYFILVHSYRGSGSYSLQVENV